jgi:hypothetical protein
MNYWDKKLIREQLDKKLSKLKPILSTPVPKDDSGSIRNDNL